MKKTLPLLFLLCTLFFNSKISAQITNVLVNGSGTHFTMESGAEMSWSYNLPVGGTALLEIWIDVDKNGTLETSTDVLWQAFSQTDGQGGQNGPPDMDGLANGQIVFQQPIGLAPAEYVMIFKDQNTTVSVSGTVNPMSLPVFTISGHVTVPAGKSAENLVVGLESDGGGTFWDALVDASGNYSIKMGPNTSGNPWKLRIDNSNRLAPAILSPDKITLTIDQGVATVYQGNDFTFTAAAAEVNGYAKDEDGNPLIGLDVYVMMNNLNFQRNARTDITGKYALGFLSSELPLSNIYLGSGNSDDTTIMSAAALIPSITNGNAITKNLNIYKANSIIQGRVTFQGNSPNFNVEMYAAVTDTAFTRTLTTTDGYYTFHVSNKLFNYYVNPGQIPQELFAYSLIAHPGQTNVNFNFTTSDVRKDDFIPAEFSLGQNFPNPFNPVTTINYSLAAASKVTIKIYNALGNETAVLLSEDKPAGNYELKWNASEMPSGVYYYQIKAGDFTQTRKMILLK